LNESGLCDELDVFIKAPEDISDVAYNNFEKAIILHSHLFEFGNKVFEYDSNHCNQGNNERSKSNGSTVIPSSPFE